MLKFLDRHQTSIVAAISFFAISAVFTRLFFGIDFTDEAQYLAQAYGPLIGGKILITDRLFQQYGSLWATPFFWLFIKVSGSTDGIVIFFRALYFGFCITIAYALYKSFRPKLDNAHAIALSTLPILYIPFSTSGFSYNNMAIQLSILSFALLRILLEKRRYYIAPLLGLTTAMGIFSYPTAAIVYFGLFLFEFMNDRNRKSLITSFVFSIFFMGVFSIPMYEAGFEQIMTNLRTSNSLMPSGILGKLKQSLNYMDILLPNLVCGISIAVCAVWATMKRSSLEFLALPILAIYYVSIANELQLDINSGFLIYGVMSVTAFLAINKFTKKEKIILSPEGYAGISLGLIMGLTSSNGMLNAALGFSVATVYFLEAYRIRTQRFPWLAWLTIVAVYSYAPWAFFYREGNVSSLTTNVTSGPYTGIYTTNLKSNYLHQIQEDLKSVPRSAKTILIFDSFPAGYLLSELEPMTFMYYMHPIFISPLLRPELMNQFVRDGARPDVVLETVAVPVTATTAFIVKNKDSNIYQDPFWGFFKSSPEYRKLIDRDFYSIYVRKGL